MTNKIIIGIATLAIGVCFAFTSPAKYQQNNDSSEWPWTKKKSAVTGTNIGDIAPELAFQNPDGKTIKLSDLKGKVVLIDFWASWCGPCRRENPHVVEAYHKYNTAKFKDAKGFEILSVSLDKSKEAWKKAIVSDKLSWKYHMSDLGGWQSKAAGIYGVKSIPMSFLVDGEGKIIAKNLRGSQLHIELDKLVSKL